MSDERYHTANVQETIALSEVCEAFESECKAAGRPAIETYLATLPAPVRLMLFRELLLTELKYRAIAGDKPTLLEYQKRFPEYSNVIIPIFADREPGQFAQPDGSKAASPKRELAISENLKKIGHYELRSCLGRGAFGQVFRAQDPFAGRDVAIKVPNRECFKTAHELEAFLSEARAVANLKHPGIVSLYHVGQDPAVGWFIAMEFVDGPNLRAALSAGRLEYGYASAIVARAADALHYAHTAGLIHRDLKPENILMDSQGLPHLADFGLTLHESKQRLHAGEFAGSPRYMSPEQVRGESHRLDGRSDIWSLGVILYECLVGRAPFQGNTLRELQDEILNREPKPLRQITLEIPAELERIVLRCLSKKIVERYTAAADLAHDLRKFANRDGPRSALAALEVPTLSLDRGHRSEASAYGQDTASARAVDTHSEVRPDIEPQTKPRTPIFNAGDRLLDRYEVQQPLGWGAISETYAAIDHKRGEQVAIKVGLPDLVEDPQALECFSHEASVARSVSHKNITRIYSIQRTKELVVLSMELLCGHKLREELQRRASERLPFTYDEAFVLLEELSDALQLVHKHYVHGDIRPEKIWVNSDGTYKLMDFGSATPVGHAATGHIGSRNSLYMAPERIGNKPLGASADQYSIGVVLYEALTLGLPQKHIQTTRELNAHVPVALSSAIMKALAPRPEARHVSMMEFVKAARSPTAGTRSLVFSAAFSAMILLAAIGWRNFGRNVAPIAPDQDKLPKVSALYSNGKLEFDGEEMNSVRQGVWNAWHSNGQFWVQGRFDNGKPVGDWEYKDPAGGVCGMRRDGIKTGTWSEWDTDLKIFARGDYSNGMRVGLWKFTTAAGVPLADLRFDKGATDSITLYKTFDLSANKDKTSPQGKCEFTYHIDSQRKRWSCESAKFTNPLDNTEFISIKRDDPNLGTLIERFPPPAMNRFTWIPVEGPFDSPTVFKFTNDSSKAGTKFEYSGYVRLGERRPTAHGEASEWSQSGELLRKQHYDNGLREGTFEAWYPNGQMRYSIQFHQDAPCGTWSFWFQNGTKEAQGQFSEHGGLGDWKFFTSDGREMHVKEIEEWVQARVLAF